MAIVHFSFDHKADSYADGAYCPLSSEYNENGRHIILWETHKGLCLCEQEENGRDDSDFFMHVWNPEKGESERICFASTRGWTYPSYGSYVDATPEVIEKYKVWKAAKDREYRIKKKWARRAHQIATAKECGLTRKQLFKLQDALNPDEFHAIHKLLKTRRFRSEFRKSLANQVRSWISAENPEYRSPLSTKQLRYLW